MGIRLCKIFFSFALQFKCILLLFFTIKCMSQVVFLRKLINLNKIL
jgi:hypothetical protein